MMRKLLIVVLCGFVQRFECTRVKFDQPFHEPVYRHDLHNEPVYKREHFYPREAIAPADQILPQQSLIRGEPIYGNEPLIAHSAPQQAVIPNDEYLANDQIVQGEQFVQPLIRREPFIRRDPLLRREAFIRGEPVIRAGRIFQNPPVFREGGIFRNEPNSYTFMVSQCPCQEAQNVAQAGPQDALFQIQQPIQPMQQPLMAHRLIFQKPVLKPQAFQPIVAFPRIQRFVRKGFKPITENIQFSPPTISTTPVQEFNTCTQLANEPVPFPGNFQNQGHQGQQQESTSESVQNNPVTVRNVPQMPNPLTLAQVSSIC